MHWTWLAGGGGWRGAAWRAWLVLPVSFRPEQSHVLQHHRDIRVFIKRLRSGIVTLFLLCMFRTASQARVAAPVNSCSLTLFSILAFINKPAANCRLALSISPLCCMFRVALVGCSFLSSYLSNSHTPLCYISLSTKIMWPPHFLHNCEENFSYSCFYFPLSYDPSRSWKCSVVVPAWSSLLHS